MADASGDAPDDRDDLKGRPDALPVTLAAFVSRMGGAPVGPANPFAGKATPPVPVGIAVPTPAPPSPRPPQGGQWPMSPSPFKVVWVGSGFGVKGPSGDIRGNYKDRSDAMQVAANLNRAPASPVPIAPSAPRPGPAPIPPGPTAAASPAPPPPPPPVSPSPGGRWPSSMMPPRSGQSPDSPGFVGPPAPPPNPGQWPAAMIPRPPAPAPAPVPPGPRQVVHNTIIQGGEAVGRGAGSFVGGLVGGPAGAAAGGILGQKIGEGLAKFTVNNVERNRELGGSDDPRVRRAEVVGKVGGAAVGGLVGGPVGAVAGAMIGETAFGKIAKVVTAVFDVGDKLRHFADGLAESSKRFAPYNAAIYTATMRLERADFGRMIAMGNQLQGSTVSLLESVNRMRNGWFGFDASMADLKNRAGIVSADLSSPLGKVFSRLGQGVDDAFKRADPKGDRLGKAAGAAADALLSPVNLALDWLGFPKAAKPEPARDFWAEYFHKMAGLGPLAPGVRVGVPRP